MPGLEGTRWPQGTAAGYPCKRLIKQAGKGEQNTKRNETNNLQEEWENEHKKQYSRGGIEPRTSDTNPQGAASAIQVAACPFPLHSSDYRV